MSAGSLPTKGRKKQLNSLSCNGVFSSSAGWEYTWMRFLEDRHKCFGSANLTYDMGKVQHRIGTIP